MIFPVCAKPVVFHWLWEGNVGGAERIVAKAFLDDATSDFEHRVIIGKTYGLTIGQREGRYCLRMAHNADLIRLNAIIPILGSVKNKILCLHHVNPYLLAFGPSRWPTVYVEHGNCRVWKGPVRDVLWNVAWQSANKRIAGIVGVSNSARTGFLKRNPRCPIPVHCIHNPLLIERGRPRALSLKPLRIGFCGRMSRVKGVTDVIECASILRDTVDAEFVIIGDGPLRKECEQRALRDRLPVSFIGAVADVSEFLAHIDILLAPSAEETFNLAVLESMALGAVPVVYPTGGMPEIVISGENGIITEEKSPASLALSVKRLALDRECLRRMSERAFDRAVSHFSLDAYRWQWDAFFTEVFQKSKQPKTVS